MNAIEVLRDEVEDTVFANPDRFAALVRDIRTFLKDCTPQCRAAEAGRLVAEFPGQVSGDRQRAAIVAQFLSGFGTMPAHALLAEMEVQNVCA